MGGLNPLTWPNVDCHPIAAARLAGFRTLVPSHEPTAGALDKPISPELHFLVPIELTCIL